MAEQHDQVSEDNAGVKIPPPLIWVGLLVIGLAIDSPWFRLQTTSAVELIIGALVFCLGACVAAASVPRHKKGGSNIEPWKPTTTIFTDGIYGYSRNPIYLAMLIGFAGIAIAAGSLAAFPLLIIFWAILQFYVIAREERYLESKFGQEYIDYRNKVRRWI